MAGPLRSVIDTTLTLVWSASAHNLIKFYQLSCAEPGFSPLADMAIVPDFPPMDDWSYAPDPSCPDALARPTDFTWILDNSFEQQPGTLNYWWPVAPANYVAFGLCFTSSATKPDTSAYWCVHERFCAPTDNSRTFWNDQGQGWSHHDGNLTQALLPTKQPPPNATVPNVLLSDEGMRNGYGTPMVLTWPDT